MPQDMEVRIEHEQGPLLPVGAMHAGAPGEHNRSVRAQVSVSKKSEQRVNSYEIHTKSYEIRGDLHEFMCPSTPEACHVLPLFVFCVVRPWCQFLERDFL